jgi:hypothetical protein
MNDIMTAHFTLCQKPWTCNPHAENMIQHRLCRIMHHQWFHIRSDLEQMWGRTGYGSSTWDAEHFFGYCSHSGDQGYIPMTQPYGPSSVINTSR